MKAKSVRVADLLVLVEKHYEANELRSIDMVKLYIKNQLMPKLGERVANNLRKSHIEDYKAQRKKEGASNSTLRNELAILRKAYSLGFEDELIERRPVIKLPPKPEPREGHYEPEEFARWQQECRMLPNGDVIADIVMFAYYSGWRLNECLRLHRDWIRLTDRIAVLPKQFSKNKRARIFPLEGKMLAMIEHRLTYANKDGLLFHRKGKPVKDLRRICKTVCGIVGVSSAHFFHNLRRSATTNLNRAGVNKETGKKITGHQTDSIYHAYNQTTLEDLRLAVKRAEEYVETTVAEKQASSNPQNDKEEQEVTGKTEAKGPENTSESNLILYQTPASNSGKNQGFLARLWRFLTKNGVSNA